ncbi:hypothetical protein HDF19_09920 [Mucilaginibacter sp. E4BP6]|uniref:hypothetical protein n=1 Tax=Mucilaginibacter sp. E4BP6 TaxID=2723089 RepID=UPI0015C6E1BE|nr:hypothetical protein [Mucilaginibacter sp. E4BP6]NYE67790.1 hypothetical protein [Mucilaginibacter sp. E4BP6]
MENVLFLGLASGALGQIIYLVFNIYKQKKAEKKLESLIVKNENEFLKMIEEYKTKKKLLHLNSEHAKDDFDELMLMTFVKNQINLLNESEKRMMNKVIERKNTENQKRYISKLFEDIKFNDFLNSHTHRKTSFNI